MVEVNLTESRDDTELVTDLDTKAKRQHKVGVYLWGKPRIYWLRE